MRKGFLGVVLTATVSALCWWPFFMIRTPDRSPLWWIPDPLIALLAGFSTFMSGGRWIRFVVASSFATFVGVCSGGAIWPDGDGIAQSYLLFGAGMATLLVAVVSSLGGLAGLMGRKLWPR